MRRFLIYPLVMARGFLKAKRSSTLLVLAANPVLAAEYALKRCLDAELRPTDLMVWEVMADDSPGVKLGVNTNGEARYEVRGDGVVYSEKSWA